MLLTSVLGAPAYAGVSRTLVADTIKSTDLSKTYTMPTSTTTIIGTDTTSTLTNKSISGSSNTLTNISLTASVTGILPVSNGGTGANTLTAHNVIVGNGTNAVTLISPSTSGFVLTSNGTGSDPTFQASGGGSSSDQSYELSGVGINSSVGSNILTVALKQKDGSTNCSSGTPCKIGFRNTTASTGGYAQASVTSSLSISTVVGASFGTQASVDQSIFVYSQYNSGIPEICLSGSLQDEGTLITTTTIGSGSTDAAVVYCSTGRSSQPLRLLSRLTVNESTPGTYASNASEVSLIPFYNPHNAFGVSISTGSSGSSTVTSTYPTFTTQTNTNWTTRRTNYGMCLNPSTAGDMGCKISYLPRGNYLITVAGEVGGSNSANGCYYRALETVSNTATSPNLVYATGGQSGHPPYALLKITSAVTNANIVIQSARDAATNCVVDLTNYPFNLDIVQL